MVTLKQLDIGRKNNFDLLRFIAATMVILSHSYLVTGNGKNEPLAKFTGFLDFGSLGVFTFFSISGFLITKSLLRQPGLNSFVLARCLRIFPGLCVAAVFCGLVIGPICTTLPLATYFSNKLLYDFMWRLATLFNFGNALPGTFAHTPYPNAVNGPIWTLPAELLLYSTVLLGGVVLLAYKKQYKALLTGLPVLCLVVFYIWMVDYKLWYFQFVKLWAYLFFWGSIYYLLRDKIKLSIRLFFLSSIIAAIVVHFRVPYWIYIFIPFLIYGIFVLAYHPLLQVKGFYKLGDCSYGLYIYAFPIQQLVCVKFPHLEPIPHFLLSFIITFPIALLSWHFIEKPILGLKTVRS